MAAIINIETSTNICSVSFSIDGNVVICKEISRGKSHASHLNIFIKEILLEANYEITKLDAIAISSGPGSYTGLRIGSSSAKGFCYALDIPLIAINTLEIMASGIKLKNAAINEKSLLAAVLDARRMEVFLAIYDYHLKCILPTQPFILDQDIMENSLQEKPILFFGNGVEKCANFFTNDSFSYDFEFSISSRYMAKISEQKFQNRNFENTSYFEPNYAKAFYSNAKNI